MATTRFSLLMDAQTRGSQEVDKLEAAINKVVNAAERGSKKSSDSFQATANNLKASIQNPLNAAGDAAESFALKYGKIGLASVGIAAGIGVVAKASFDLVRSVGNAAEAMLNMADRTGLSVSQIDKLTAMGRIAGVSIDSMESSSRLLAVALEDTGTAGNKTRSALDRLGVSLYDVKGNERELGAVHLETIERLSEVASQSERVALANQILGRSAKEIQPLIANYAALKKSAESMGFGNDTALLRQLADAGDELDKFSLKWDLLKRKLAVPASAIVNVITQMMPGGNGGAGNNYLPNGGLGFAPGYYQGGMGHAGIDVREALKSLNVSGSVGLRELQYAREYSAAQQVEARRMGFESMMGSGAEGQQRRIKELEAEMSALVPKGLAGAPGAEEAYRKLQAEKKSIEKAIEAQKEADTKLKQFREERTKFLEKLADTYSSEFARPHLGLGQPFASKRSTAEGLPEDLMLLDVQRGLRDAQLGRFQDQMRQETLGRGAGRISGLELTQGSLADARATAQGRLLEASKRQFDFETQRIQLLAGPGGEVDAINRITALRLTAADQLKSMGVEQHEIEIARLDAVRDRELQLLDLRKRGMEEYKQSVMSAFDALVSGGKTGFGSFLKSQGIGVARQVAGNIAGMTYSSGRLSLTDNPNSTIGRLLQGTPFGADPMKGAAISLDTAGMKLSLAADKLMAVSATGGGGGVVRSLLGSIPGINIGSNVIGAIPGQSPVSSAITDSLSKIGITMPGQKPGMTLGRGIGLASAIGGGAIGVYSGIQTGGVRGALAVGGSALSAAGAGIMAAAPASGPAAPIMLGIGAALGMATMLFGDQKQKRAERLSSEAESRQFTEPTGAEYSQDIYGRSLDRDYRGKLRPIVVNNYNVSAMDAKSFVDWGKANGAAIAEVTTSAITSGNGEDLLGTVRQYL